MIHLLLIATGCAAAAPSVSADSFAQAYQRSLATGRPFVVLLGADWCPGCRMMKSQVMPAVAKAGGLANVEFAYIDIDRQRQLVGRLARGKTIPQLVRLQRTPAGWRWQHLTGVHRPSVVASFIRNGATDRPKSQVANGHVENRTVARPPSRSERRAFTAQYAPATDGRSVWPSASASPLRRLVSAGQLPAEPPTGRPAREAVPDPPQSQPAR